MRRFGPLAFFAFIVIFSFFFFKISIRDLMLSISRIKPWELCILLLVFVFVSLLSVMIKKYLLRAAGYRVSLRNMGLIYFSATTAHYSSPAKLGFPLTLYLQNTMCQVPYAVSGSLLVVEISASLLVTGLVIAFGSMPFLYQLAHRISWFTGGLVALGLAIAASSALFFARDWTLRHLTNLYRTAGSVPKSTWVVLPLLLMLSYALTGGFIMLSVRFLSSGISLPSSIVVSAISHFAGAISFIPMGLGVSDFSMMACLQVFHVPAGAAIGVVALYRLFFTACNYGIGLLSGMVLGLEGISKKAPPR